jgi:hypothetical protein
MIFVTSIISSQEWIRLREAAQQAFRNEVLARGDKEPATTGRSAPGLRAAAVFITSGCSTAPGTMVDTSDAVMLTSLGKEIPHRSLYDASRVLVKAMNGRSEGLELSLQRELRRMRKAQMCRP